MEIEMESSNIENYNNNDFYSYLQKNELTYTYYINHTASTRHQKVRLTCRALAQHKEIRDNY